MRLTEGKRPSVPSSAVRTVSVVRSVGPQGLRQMARVAVREALIPMIVLAWSWLATAAQFSAIAASAESSPDFCNITKNVFFDNRAYELDCRYEPGGESPKYKVTFKEQTPRLGELKVTGTDLHRLILTAKPVMTVVLGWSSSRAEPLQPCSGLGELPGLRLDDCLLEPSPQGLPQICFAVLHIHRPRVMVDDPADEMAPVLRGGTCPP